MSLLLGSFHQAKTETGTTFGRQLDANGAPEFLHHAPDDGEAKPRAPVAVPINAAQGLEQLEDLRLVARLDARPVVGNTKLVILVGLRKFDF